MTETRITVLERNERDDEARLPRRPPIPKFISVLFASDRPISLSIRLLPVRWVPSELVANCGGLMGVFVLMCSGWLAER